MLLALIKDIIQTPIFWFVVCFVGALYCHLKHLKKRRALALFFTFFWYLGLTPLGADWWLQTLAHAAPPVTSHCQQMARSKQIIILPGGLDWWSDRPQVHLSTWSRERADSVLQQFVPGDRILIPGSDALGDYQEDRALQHYLLAKGVMPESITVGPPSRTTFENLNTLKPHLDARPVLLATSFWHLARAQGAATALSIPVCPLGSGAIVQHYDLRPQFIAHWQTAAALHEWLGLLWYAITARN